MEFIIDNREKDIKEKLNAKEYLKFENLEVGDINIKYNGEIKIVIERKNIKDFSNSIKDGRYAEQKIRLKSLKLEPSNIYFLIEGKINKDIKKKVSGITYDTIISSMISLMIRDNFKIYKTENIDETIIFLEKLYDKLLKKSSEWFGNESDKPEQNYVSTIKLKKKDNLTPENCYLLQLSQIPGISTNIAQAISNKYPNFNKLYENYNLCENKELMLKNLEYPIANNKVRKIGKKTSEKIYNYLF